MGEPLYLFISFLLILKYIGFAFDMEKLLDLFFGDIVKVIGLFLLVCVAVLGNGLGEL